VINRSKRPVFVAVLAIATICALLLALPGQTVATKYLNDLFIFLDGVHRVVTGQVPSRDFHTALGPLNYYIPALGYWLSGHYGGAMPVGLGLLILLLAPVGAHILDTRMRPALAIPLGAFLILVAAVPINLGEGIRSLSFAMFYNRIGWAALGFLLVMHLRPDRAQRHQAFLDACCAAFLVLLMLYLKISYGLFGLLFLVFMLLDSQQRSWAAAALAITTGVGLIVEAVWQSSAAHVDDLLLAGRVSGSIDAIDELAQTLIRNFADYVLFAIVGVLVLACTRSVRDFLFLGFCAGSGFLLIGQNFQDWGIVTLAAGAAVAAESLARADKTVAERHRWSVTAGGHLLFFAFVLPTMVHNGAALGLHAALASTRYGQPLPLPNFDRIRLAKLWSDDDYPSFARYLSSLEDGARALASLDEVPSRVVVLDFVGPFSAGLGLEPPRGDSTWHHWGRTMNEVHHLPPERLFADVRVVMDPKWPVESWTADGLRQIYADYLAQRYELAQETTDWKVYVVRQAPDPHETASQTIESNPPGGSLRRGG
jgi:hypothetical protein